MVDDTQVNRDLENSQLDDALPADLLSIAPLTAEPDDDRPDPALVLPDGLFGADDRDPADAEPLALGPPPSAADDAGDDGWSAELPGPLFEADEPSEALADVTGTDGPELPPGSAASAGAVPVDPAAGVWTPGPASAAFNKPRFSGFARGDRAWKGIRVAGAGMAVAALLGAVAALSPDPHRPSAVETGLPQTTVTTLRRPAPPPLSPLLAPAAAQATDAMPPATEATEAPAADAPPPAAAGAGPAPGPPSGAARSPSGSPTSSPPATPRTGATSGPPASGPPPASRADPAPPPAPASAPEPAPAPAPSDPAPRERRSETAVAQTTPPATEAPRPPTTQQQWVPPEPPPPPPLPLPTATTPPPTAPPPSVITVPTHRCLDGNPPRPVACSPGRAVPELSGSRIGRRRMRLEEPRHRPP